jgi:hypothetical protein
MNRFFSFLIYVTIFLSSITFFNEPFEGYFHYVIFIFFFPFFIAKYGFPKIPFQILALPLFFGIFQIYAGYNTFELFTKIFLGIFFSTTFYYYVIHAYNMDVEKMFSIYMKGIYFVCLIGLLQLASYFAHFTPGYNFKWIFNKWAFTTSELGFPRVNSIFPEPSQFALVISPALFIAIYNLLLGKRLYIARMECLMIIVITILTTSSLGLIAFLFIVIFLTINYGHLVNLFVALICLFAIGELCYAFLPEFKSRVNSAYGLWVENDFRLANVNNSSFVLFNHYHIATTNFKEHPLVGTGLGSHPLAFDKYTITLASDIIDFNNNRADANSTFLRLMSETGLMGITFILYFIFRFYIRRDPLKSDEENKNYWIISNAVLVLIIVQLLRQGNYFINGFPFFMWMYYYTYKVNKTRLELDLAEKISD